MKPWNRFFPFFLAPLLGLYLFAFFGAGSFYLFSSFKQLFWTQSLGLSKIFLWTSMGLCVSLLTSLACWPFALSVATLIEHNKSRPITAYFRVALSYFSTLPLIIFVYVYIEVIGGGGFGFLKEQWTYLFASPNFLTQFLAFAMTLLLYPLNILPLWGSEITVDAFYNKMLSGVIEFAELGFVALIILSGLFLYILPKMILHMGQQLREDENHRSFEIIQSLGGTSWESVHLTVMQSMKNRFGGIVSYFTRICFFEGIIAYTLLYYFVADGSLRDTHWGSSLGAVYINFSLQPEIYLSSLMALAGLMIFYYGLFMYSERYFRHRREAYYV